MRVKVKRERAQSYYTQWAAQFFVGAELTRRGYIVSYPLGNAPVTDLQVTSPNGQTFPLEVKGLRGRNYWLVKRPAARGERYYMLLLVPRSTPFEPVRYFILSKEQLRRIHCDDPSWPGMPWRAVLPYENRWGTLPR